MREIAFKQLFLPVSPTVYLFVLRLPLRLHPLVTATSLSQAYFIPPDRKVFVYGTKKAIGDCSLAAPPMARYLNLLSIKS